MEKIKGRPSLPSKRKKRLHYSVWLNEEQKQKIDERISKSNLSASQYILAQLELVPVKLPARRDIPDHISRQIINLEKLSGILAFYAHRTKDKQLITSEWMKSSQVIRRLSELVSKWLFEQFEIPALRNFFETNIHSFEKLLHLIGSGEDTEEQRIYLSEVYKLYKINELTFGKYKSYYSRLDHDLSIFQTYKVTVVEDVHAEIQNEIKQILQSL
ncbi:hypothetical protein FEM33_20285 [Dyadobacter flavalbus]|uniref:Uncharacterized protein n=1 Tax=Dyadobacter flavalbus TaxID=2579942 RepID=A0A5M8QPU6_9BACT|nr:hypothetical protein [Dyadobacter flavalbus]KAA6437060.1 hypothetical protein FEM33_20285 [Dyadobacter flavalbus]